MDIDATTSRSLSRTEANIVLGLEWRGTSTVTLADLRGSLRKSDVYARRLAHALVRKGWLERLRPGVFRLIPADRGPQGIADTNPLTAGAALVRPYFFSFGTACTHHGLTEQVFSEVYIACQRPLRPRIVRDTRYVFAVVPPARFFGFEEVAALGERVQMATRERALLDAIDRPQLAGGVGEVSRMVARAGHRLDWQAALDLLRRWDNPALVQRLGYLLDLHRIEIPTWERAMLLAIVRPKSKILLGPRARWGTSGRLAGCWNVVENVPGHLLVETGGSARRRKVVLGGKGRRA